MIQRNDKQARGTSKNETRMGSRAGSRRPQMETDRYEETPSRLALFTEPPHDKPVYSIGELVTVAYERAGLLADDADTEALVATRLLAEWLIHARSMTPLAEPSAESSRIRRALPRQQREGRVHRASSSRRNAFANARGFRAAA